jgi:hypothetical protein
VLTALVLVMSAADMNLTPYEREIAPVGLFTLHELELEDERLSDSPRALPAAVTLIAGGTVFLGSAIALVADFAIPACGRSQGADPATVPRARSALGG